MQTQENVLNYKEDTPTSTSPGTKEKDSGLSKNLIRFLKTGYINHRMNEKEMLVFFMLCVILGLCYSKFNIALPVSSRDWALSRSTFYSSVALFFFFSNLS